LQNAASHVFFWHPSWLLDLQLADAAEGAPAAPALLQVMGEREQLREAVRWLAANVTFDIDARVHVFELTIRAVGGMLSAHMLLEQVGALGAGGWLMGQASRGRHGRQAGTCSCGPWRSVLPIPSY
jgi:hypothetical protein